MLKDVLTLVFKQNHEKTKCEGWKFHPEHGLILCWYKGSNVTPFPGDLTAEQTFPIVINWLNSQQAKSVKCAGWDADAPHDGSNSIGWRVYCEDWGKVDGMDHAICAVKPAYMWHGK